MYIKILDFIWFDYDLNIIAINSSLYLLCFHGVLRIRDKRPLFRSMSFEQQPE